MALPSVPRATCRFSRTRNVVLSLARPQFAAVCASSQAPPAAARGVAAGCFSSSSASSSRSSGSSAAAAAAAPAAAAARRPAAGLVLARRGVKTLQHWPATGTIPEAQLPVYRNDGKSKKNRIREWLIHPGDFVVVTHPKHPDYRHTGIVSHVFPRHNMIKVFNINQMRKLRRGSFMNPRELSFTDMPMRYTDVMLLNPACEDQVVEDLETTPFRVEPGWRRLRVDAEEKFTREQLRRPRAGAEGLYKVIQGDDPVDPWGYSYIFDALTQQTVRVHRATGTLEERFDARSGQRMPVPQDMRERHLQHEARQDGAEDGPNDTKPEEVLKVTYNEIVDIGFVADSKVSRHWFQRSMLAGRPEMVDLDPGYGEPIHSIKDKRPELRAFDPNFEDEDVEDEVAVAGGEPAAALSSTGSEKPADKTAAASG